MATSYRELVIEGPTGWTLGYVHGFLEARGGDTGILDAEAEGFDCQPFRERFRELLRRASETVHLLVPEQSVAAVREAIDAAASAGKVVRLVADEAVRAARFEFSFEIFSKKHADRVRGYFRELPDGIELTASFKKREDPDAKGIEAYAPVHEYELRGEGTVEGPADGVLELYRRCTEEELVRTGPLRLLHDGD